MNTILESILGSENQSAFKQIQQKFNLDEHQTKAAVQELIPALSRGLRNNTQETHSMEELLEALRTGEHEKYVERPGTLAEPEATRDGNDILGHIFGDKKVSREVAERASQKSGLSSTILKQMLPMLASVVMGSLSKKVLGGSNTTSARTTTTGAGGLLTSFLDSDGDGSIWDDVLGMAARGMRR